jgi:hypothetical protein
MKFPKVERDSRLSELIAAGSKHQDPNPLAKLLMGFESLGDNCEFGLVQRIGGVEPLGLLRFAGIHLPVEVRLQRLIDGLIKGFEGVGSADSISVSLEGAPGRREYIVSESRYKLRYHTFISEGGEVRGGPGCLNRFSASISGASARVRLPSGVAAG